MDQWGQTRLVMHTSIESDPIDASIESDPIDVESDPFDAFVFDFCQP